MAAQNRDKTKEIGETKILVKQIENKLSQFDQNHATLKE